MPLEYPDPDLRSSLVRLRKWSYDDLRCIEAASADPEIPQGAPQGTPLRNSNFRRQPWYRAVHDAGLPEG